MTIATIDIGTNTVLLLVAVVDAAGSLRTLAYEQRIPRLGRDVDARHTLDAGAINRVVDVLQEYAAIIERYSVDRIVVCGTSAVRDASNRQDLADAIHRATGYFLEVLSGDEEAVWTYRGAISGISPAGSGVVLDIGGGSTEITAGDGKRIVHHRSYDIGSVRLTERFFKSNPPTTSELQKAMSMIDEALGTDAFRISPGSRWIGVAGTVTTLALVAQGQSSFAVEGVTNTCLTVSEVQTLRDRFAGLPSAEIRRISSVLEGRADVILAGTLILHRIMELHHLEEILVSERGLRYGLAIREWERTDAHPGANASGPLPSSVR